MDLAVENSFLFHLEVELCLGEYFYLTPISNVRLMNSISNTKRYPVHNALQSVIHKGEMSIVTSLDLRP